MFWQTGKPRYDVKPVNDFELFEIVRINSGHRERQDLNGFNGFIIGDCENDNDSEAYLVIMLLHMNDMCCVPSSELVSLGVFLPEDQYREGYY